jgi:site-specific recombinase XerD
MKKQPLTSLDTRLGPWAGYVNTYTRLIEERGYSPQCVREQTQLISRFTEWLWRGHTEIRALDETLVQRFLSRQQKAGRTRHGDAAALYRFLHMLREQGVTPLQQQPPPSPKQRLITNYKRYLLEERGLAPATVINYVAYVDQFLWTRFRQGPLSLRQLRAPDVTSFVRQKAHKLKSKCAHLLVTALRSFLRYLQHQGKITTDLAVCVPVVACWSFAVLPKFLPTASVRRMLQRTKRRTPVGRRDYAILLLLARLGLRACEVVALNLEDIDWENARLTVAGKGGHRVQLPLPADVGEAIAQYLCQGRPCCSCRRVFIRDRAPRTGFANRRAICTLVRRALERAGVDSARKGAHLLRHSLATAMIRRGASLDEIGNLLGHQSPETTMIYAKVDLPALKTLALPWPGGAR